ncbi:MAG TPA: hypothetical protein VH327_00410 [Gammaproteobacteria bacterium]|nr:hypothetical protein [Gammaproteobacteria bacterium]
MVLIAVWVRFMSLLQPPADEVAGRVFPPDTAMDEFVTVATYDKVTDAHIALGRLSAEGIEAQLFDVNMVQMDWLYSIALGGVKLRVARGDEKAARQVLETDYSKTLEDADLGSRED